jgi:pilus assembly protein CpaE
MGSKSHQITALLIAPNRRLAEQFVSSMSSTRAFDIIGDLEAYPTPQALESKLRQLRPEVVLLDVATNLDSATELIRQVTALNPPAHVIGLHTHNDSEAILRSLRFGATEFLYTPFEVSIQEAAISRIQKLLQPAGLPDRAQGRIVSFSSAKPGAGASTLAVQTAYALRRATGRRVLLADFDLLCGSAAFYLNAEHEYSLVNALQHSGRMTHDFWSTITVDADGIDVLPAPEMPYVDAVDQKQINEVLEHARNNYDWSVIDLPCIFHRLSLVAVMESDRAFLVSTPELASLHLARRAVKLLTQIGMDSQKFQVLINRALSRDDLGTGNLSKLFDCRVDTSLPDDRLGIQRAVTLGKPIEGQTDLGRAIDALAGKLMGALPEKKPVVRHLVARPAFSQG